MHANLSDQSLLNKVKAMVGADPRLEKTHAPQREHGVFRLLFFMMWVSYQDFKVIAVFKPA